MIAPSLLSTLALALVAQVDFDGSEVACVLAPLTPAERTEIGGGAYGEPRREAVLGRLAAAGHECARRNGWPDARAEQIATVAYTILLRARGAALLQAAGIDPAAVDRWFDRQPEAARASASTDALDSEALARDLLRAGINPETVRSGAGVMGAYVAVRVAQERLRRGLAVR